MGVPPHAVHGVMWHWHGATSIVQHVEASRWLSAGIALSLVIDQVHVMGEEGQFQRHRARVAAVAHLVQLSHDVRGQEEG